MLEPVIGVYMFWIHLRKFTNAVHKLFGTATLRYSRYPPYSSHASLPELRCFSYTAASI